MKLSIITINYNNKDGLQKTIDSVITQTFKDFEWIIIDGGSTDGSKELIKQYSQYITYWVSEPDNGVYHAMNKGIRQAKGEYLQFLNSGDYLVNKSTLLKVFQHCFHQDIIWGNSLYLSKPIKRYDNHNSDLLSCFDIVYKNINHQAMFIKKNLYNKYGLYDEKYKILSDWKFNIITIGIYKCSTKYINNDIVYYDMNGISTKETHKRKAERKMILNELFLPGILDDYLFFFKLYEIRKKRILRFFFSILYRISQL